MRILLLTHYFEPENGAPQRRWRALLERFSAAGHEVHVVAPIPHYPDGKRLEGFDRSIRPGVDEVTEYGAVVHRVSYLEHDGTMLRRAVDHAWVAGASVARAWTRRADEAAPDVVIATAPAIPTVAAGLALARRYRAPLVVEMRDAWPDLVSHTPGLKGGSRAKQQAKLLLHRAITVAQRRADLVVTTTTSFAELLRDRGLHDVVAIRNGTVPERYAQIGPVVHDHAELRVLYMGTVGRSQGLDTVISAAALLRKRGVAASVRIIGSGIDHARLRRLNALLDEPVDLRSSVPGGEVIEHYRWADTCIVSLRDWAPFSLTVPSKLYELMATGKHVTAILQGEAAAIVHATGGGDVVPPGDAEALADTWERLAADRTALDVGADARAWVREHASYDSIARQYLDELERLRSPAG